MRSICCCSFGDGPRFAALGSSPTSSSRETPNSFAMTGSAETGMRRRPTSYALTVCWETFRDSANCTWVMPWVFLSSAMRAPRRSKKARSSLLMATVSFS